jgi:RNA polymerase sigma-70 factor, ECF subfamily
VTAKSSPTAHAAFDARLLESLGQGRVADAATLALETYGDEIYALLAALHRNDSDAGEVFSLFCESLWTGLAGFEGRSSFRTWAYTVAWRASARYRSRVAREVLVSDSEFLRLADRVRNSTQSRLAREKRNRLRELRDTLPPEDQTILILRVERELDWRDLTRVFHDGETLDEATLERESSRLRKRFQLIKEQLRKLATAETE